MLCWCVADILVLINVKFFHCCVECRTPPKLDALDEGNERKIGVDFSCAADCMRGDM